MIMSAWRRLTRAAGQAYVAVGCRSEAVCNPRIASVIADGTALKHLTRRGPLGGPRPEAFPHGALPNLHRALDGEVADFGATPALTSDDSASISSRQLMARVPCVLGAVIHEHT